MSRIVAGTAGGRMVRVPAKGTRPTSDRVREAMFSRLDHAGVVRDARVLDLFAGSGALGLEATSRGAARAVLVEASRDAARTCRGNAAALGLADRVDVVVSRVETYLGAGRPRVGAVGAVAPFDLAFLDPPYDLDDDALAAILTTLATGWLAQGAVVVVERSRRSAEPRWPAALSGADTRTYGDTALWFATVGE